MSFLNRALTLSATAAVAFLISGCGPAETPAAKDSAATGAAPAGSQAQSGRDYVYVVGSSTVYPFATVVAERFGRGSEFKTPKIESTGSGGGLKLFCTGIGVDHPDVTNSSRAIKQSEVDSCAANGVTEIVEVKIGYDGIVIANAIGGASVALSRADIFMALAKEVPGEGEGELVENPYETWADVNPALPAERIEVLGPPPTSGTRDAFVELAMEGGCQTVPWIKALKSSDSNRYKAICHTIREDGAFVEAGENDNLIVQKLEANPGAFGIFGFSFLDQNAEKVKGAQVDGVSPTFDAIANGDYPVSRPLYFYVKKAHVDVIPGLRGFLNEFSSERAWGEEGYLSERGLIPMPTEERSAIAAAVRNLTPLSMAGQ
ncbi:MAG: substrate-binding domain-containing protein [Gammaproteobacteria bacterium]|nr:substrate-binding domain-containing protein [Gammaproteobacteria bacterium]MBT8104346.1 substrate-binding domain-containing protein [Gammaproteobacteria bacterium]NNF50710.1 phosphate ABC transporter substrate-binding protein [Woeseiaceae bacterium]NNK24362.1 phosphate ABC transporter substrate-binding protein [Woeseiaceae bacterium]